MKAPEKRHAAHEAHQKRRIPDGRQTAAHVGHQEDKEHDDVPSVLPPRIHLNDRTDHQHAGSRGPDPAGKDGSQRQEAHIDPGRARQVTGHGNIAGYAEQAEQQDDKRQIIIDDTLQHRFRRPESPVHQGKRHHKQQRPEGHRMGLVLLPPMGLYKRKHSNT